MKPLKLSTNFTPYTDADFLGKAAYILKCMEGNTHFPDPIPTLESIRLLYNQYTTALINAGGGGRFAISQKNTLREQLAHELARLSLYVMYIADGNEVILASSGFNFTKTPQASHITVPASITIMNGISTGELISSIKAVKGAKAYIHEIAIGTIGDDAGKLEWKSYTSSRRSYTYKQLTPGVCYVMRVTAIGTGNQRTTSPKGQKWAQ